MGGVDLRVPQIVLKNWLKQLITFFYCVLGLKVVLLPL